MDNNQPFGHNNNSEEVDRLINQLEESSIIDITNILNKVSYLFSREEIKEDDYIEIIKKVNKRASHLAGEIYNKNNENSSSNLLDLEEYRTLQDIARECREYLNELGITKYFVKKITPEEYKK